MYSAERNKEETSYKHVSKGAVFLRFDHFKYQITCRAASCLTAEDRHFEHVM